MVTAELLRGRTAGQGRVRQAGRGEGCASRSPAGDRVQVNQPRAPGLPGVSATRAANDGSAWRPSAACRRMRWLNGMRWTLIVAAMALTVARPSAQSSGASIVEEALKGVRQDQARDSERVKRMVDEAVQGTQQAPSGQDTVNPGGAGNAAASGRPGRARGPAGRLPGRGADRPADRRRHRRTHRRHSRPRARRGQRRRSGHGRVPAAVRPARQDLGGADRVADHGHRAWRGLRHGADHGRVRGACRPTPRKARCGAEAME